jgi:multidrug efflux pump subunit AcrA (membrane-fusion protein)
MNIRRWALPLGVAAAVAVAAVAYWRQHNGDRALEHIASGNGRIEAVEIDIAPRQPGRIEAIEVREGELVRSGQVLVRMDTESLQAQLRQAEARLQQAEDAVGTARSQLAQRDSEKAAVQAVVVQRQTELTAAQRRAQRFADLRQQAFISQQQLDDQTETVDRAAAVLAAARAQVAASDAAIAAARNQIRGSESAVEAARAEVARIRTDIDDSLLKAPRDGRVQLIVARTGEVVGAARHSGRAHGRPDRPGRRRQVQPAGAGGGRARDPGRARSRCWAATWPAGRHRARCARASPTCRRGWARTSTRRCRCSRTSTSSAACSATTGERERRIANCWTHRPGAFRDRPAGKLSGGMKQKLGCAAR